MFRLGESSWPDVWMKLFSSRAGPFHLALGKTQLERSARIPTHFKSRVTQSRPQRPVKRQTFRRFELRIHMRREMLPVHSRPCKKLSEVPLRSPVHERT